MYLNAKVCMDRKFQIWNSYLHAQIKFRELLETPEEDNQQPNLDGNISEGSTTSSESLIDNNSTTSAGHSLLSDDIV